MTNKTAEDLNRVFNRKRREIKKSLETLSKKDLVTELWEELEVYENNYGSQEALDLLFAVVKNSNTESLLKIVAEIKARVY